MFVYIFICLGTSSKSPLISPFDLPDIAFVCSLHPQTLAFEIRGSMMVCACHRILHTKSHSGSNIQKWSPLALHSLPRKESHRRNKVGVESVTMTTTPSCWSTLKNWSTLRAGSAMVNLHFTLPHDLNENSLYHMTLFLVT